MDFYSAATSNVTLFQVLDAEIFLGVNNFPAEHNLSLLSVLKYPGGSPAEMSIFDNMVYTLFRIEIHS